jgi:hypothetical protein
VNRLCNIATTQDDYAEDTQVFGMVSNNTSKYCSEEKKSEWKSEKNDRPVYDVFER